MYKWLIITIISIFVGAFFIGQCTNAEIPDEISGSDNIAISIKDTTVFELEVELEDSSPQSHNKFDINQINDFSYIDDTLSVALEIPKITDPIPNQILYREGYTLSYNKTTKCANWVAWRLSIEHTDGEWSRKGIKYNEDIEAEYPRQEVGDWRINPNRYDHGHMCPAGDNKWSKLAMEQSFLLTNMCPQNRRLNGGDWKELEEKCRDWANEYGEIYIVCGPIYYNGKNETIGGSKEIWVPDAFYKVVLCMKDKPKSIGFIYPNKGKHHLMEHYVLTVNDVENQTGIDFFYTLSDIIEEEIESQTNLTNW